jgi:hypothetical protein
VNVLFTTRPGSPISWLIRTVTQEKCSHCAVQLGDFAIHSDFRGVIVEPLDEFIEKNKVIYTVYDVPQTTDLGDVLKAFIGKPYDFLGLIYLGFRLIIPILPKANLWQVSGMYFCNEFVSAVILNKENSNLTPTQLYNLLKDKQYDS